MLTFQQFNESLNTPVKVAIGPMIQARVTGTFAFDGLVFLMEFHREHKNEQVFFGAPDVPGDSYWSCDFAPSSATYNAMRKTNNPLTTGMYGIIGSGNEFRVFAGAVQTFKAFVAKYHPDSVSFTGEEESRQRLYRRFMGLVKSAIPGYAGKEIDRGVYVIYRK